MTRPTGPGPRLPSEPLRLTPGRTGETAAPPAGTEGPAARGEPAVEGPVQAPAAEERSELATCVDDLKRVQAEYDNYRKRVRRDRLRLREAAVANVLQRLLPVLDTIAAAREHGELSGGSAHVADMLEAETAALGLESFAAPGDPFDPWLHEALTHAVSEDVERATCTEVLRAGYRVGGRLLRPAQVAVTGPPTAPGPAR